MISDIIFIVFGIAYLVHLAFLHGVIKSMSQAIAANNVDILKLQADNESLKQKVKELYRSVYGAEVTI